jgi:transmembrane sensor
MNVQIAEEAANWFVRLRDDKDNPDLRWALAAWMRQSPEHIRAYLEIAAIWSDAAQVRPEIVGDAETLAARARRAQDVLELLPRPVRPAEPEPILHPWLRHARTASISFLAVAAALIASTWWFGYRTQTYATDIGEQRTITLADGSTIELNSQSKVRVDYSTSRREIDHVAGQALFRVAKDAARPFAVQASGTEVTAVGTIFDVYRSGRGTVVTVVEGAVRVARRAETASPIPLLAGQQVIVEGALEALRIGNPAPVNVANATAWTQGQLIFESATLEEVVAEVNRYNRRKLMVQGEGPPELRIGGIFSSADLDSLVRFLRAQPGLEVTEAGGEYIITYSK